MPSAICSLFLGVLSQAAPVPAPVAPAPAPAPAAPAPKFAQPRLLVSGFAAEPCWPLVADLDGDSFGELIAVNPEAGVVDVARSVRGGKFMGPVNAAKELGPLAAATTRVGANGRAEVVVDRKEGGRRIVAFGDDAQWSVRDDAPPPSVSSASNPGAAPAVDAALAQEMATLASRFPGSIVVAGDVSGDRRDDLVVFRRDDAYRCGRDALVCVAYQDGDADADGDGLDAAAEARWKSDPLDSDSDHDGLLDGWEVKGEGAIDFPALGASPVHKDCFVYVQRYAETDGAGCAHEMARVVKTWAELKNPNPDGTTGIALHPIWLPPLPPGTPGRAWWDLGNENLPKTARGLAHYMNIYAGGGGQASELGEMGGCGQNAFWACFLHEFGHQVGLSHGGGPSGGGPTYTSLMSYTYSYGFNDDGNQIHYSHGEFADLVLNETRLSERLPFKYERLQFLEKGPYRFKLQADGDATRIDWNRDGQIQDGPVRADIDDVYGVGALRMTVGKTTVAPVLFEHGGRLHFIGVNREKRLFRREIQGLNQLEPECFIDSVKPTGDPAAIDDGASVLLLVPTEEGIATLSASAPEGLEAATPLLLPDSKGLAVSGALFGGRPLVLLWKDETTPVTMVTRDDAGAFTPARPLVNGGASFTSTIPPAAAEDPATHELVVGFGAKRGPVNGNGGERLAWRLLRLARSGAEGDGGFTEVSQRSVGDENCGWYGNARPLLLIEHGPDAIAEGRIHFIGRGSAGPPNFNQCSYEAITIGDATQNDGWRLRRFCDEWSTTRSPPGACFHADESGRTQLVVAYRWFGNVHGDEDDDVHVMLNATGISDVDVRDFDDVAAIADLGLERSIPWRDPAAR